MARPLRIAAAQYAPHVGDGDGNRALAVSWAMRAADEGAQLIVLPELASSGYVFETDVEADADAEPRETSRYLDGLAAVARDRGCHIVTGFSESGEGCRHNSAAAIGPAGVIAVYRKLHLFYDEQRWFVAGNGVVVVDLPWGRLGLLICYDLWFPEVARALALNGAEVLAVPTNWVGNFKSTVYDERGWCQGDYVAAATAAQSGVVLVCADRVGVERGTHFLGASVIVGADGWPIAGPASPGDDALLIADVDLDAVEHARNRTPRNHLLDDRRPDAYNVAITGMPEPPAVRRSPS